MTKGIPCLGGYALAAVMMCALGLSPQLWGQQTAQPQPAAPATQTPSTTTGGHGAVQSPTTPAAVPATAPTAPGTPAAPANDSPAGQSQPAPASNRPQNDRIFFALPNYLTVENGAHLPPLTTREKFQTVAEGCFDPVEVVFIGIQAGIDQADNANPTYRQGFSGYSKRFGTDYADAIIGNFGTGAIFPSLLHQDPRYYQMGHGKFLRRFTHAALRVVVTRSDSTGRNQFNFSEFLGNGMAAGLSNFYHPAPHTIASSSDVLGTQVLLDSVGYELKEFWPDIHRLLRHSK